MSICMRAGRPLVITAIVERRVGVLIFTNLHSGCCIETQAPWEARSVLAEAKVVKYCRVCVRRGEKDGGGGDARYVSESDGISFLLAECEEFPIGCVRPLQDMSPCVVRDGQSVVVLAGRRAFVRLCARES